MYKIQNNYIPHNSDMLTKNATLISDNKSFEIDGCIHIFIILYMNMKKIIHDLSFKMSNNFNGHFDN